MIATGLTCISNIICITELQNKPKVDCTQLKRLYWVISSQFIPNFEIFQTSEKPLYILLCNWKFHNKPHTRKGVHHYHTFHSYSNEHTHFPGINISQIHLRKKEDKKACITLQNHFFCTSKQLFAIHVHFLLVTCNVCPPEDPGVLCENTGI